MREQNREKRVDGYCWTRGQARRKVLSYSRSRLSTAKLPLNCHELELELRMIINDRKGASHYGSIKCNVSLIDNTLFSMEHSDSMRLSII